MKRFRVNSAPTLFIFVLLFIVCIPGVSDGQQADAITAVGTTQCEVSNIIRHLGADVTVKGRIRADRAVENVKGWLTINGRKRDAGGIAIRLPGVGFSGGKSFGDFSAGQTKSFSITRFVRGLKDGDRCGADFEWREVNPRPQRVTPPVPVLTQKPDLVLERVRAVPSTVAPGATFRLNATLRNRGTGVSTATTVRYYRSSNDFISTGDTHLGSGKRGPLAPNATISRALEVTVPTTPGTYYYGVCVDTIRNESDTGNNCSRAVSVTVTAPPRVSEDVTADGVVDVKDLVYVAERYGQTGGNRADVNADGVVNIADLMRVAGVIDANAGASPSLSPIALAQVSVSDVRAWLSEARGQDLTDTRGLRFLEALLAVLTPKETVLLANYPNPFNPETWIPYELATDTDVRITIYTLTGVVVRALQLGHQSAGYYIDRERAAYWDGRNALGEQVASGVYFYQLETDAMSSLRKMVILK